MKPHVLDAGEVLAALEDVVHREFTLASAASRSGGRKLLNYHAGRKIFIVKETNSKDMESGTAEMAAIYYSDR